MIKKEPKTSPKAGVELEDLFLDIHQRMISVLRKEAEKLGFSMTQLETLRFVVEKGDPTMKDVAKYLNITAPSATAIVENLVEKKLVTRKVSMTDRRTVHLIQTNTAKKLFVTFRKIKAKIFSDILVKLNKEDKKTLSVILSKLI